LAALAAAIAANPSCIELERESTIRMSASGYSLFKSAATSSAEPSVPLISEEMNTPTTGSPTLIADSNAALISPGEGCDEVGILGVAAIFS